jgi:cytochrome d ubiquinol oxidase subunit II
MMDLTIIWAFIIAFAVAAYVVMDGFDLGIGILFPFFGVGKERDQAMNSIAPVWDGNETWLVLGGGGLMAAFPLAYAIVLPALYAPLIAMLLGLVFRGVAFEFRWRDPGHRRWWDTGFFLGSLVATFMQGVTLGASSRASPSSGRAYGGGWWDWLTPFSLLVGGGAGGRLRLARRLLADLEDRRRDPGRRAPLCAHPAADHVRDARARSASPRPSSSPNISSAGSNFPGLIATIPCRSWCSASLSCCGAGLRRDVDWHPFLYALMLFFLSMIGPGRLDLAGRDPRPRVDLAGGGAL